MYYPKSQIKTNLYTNGNKLMYSDTKQNYIGYYWVTSKEEFFSGKNPDDPNTKSLIKIVIAEVQNKNSNTTILDISNDIAINYFSLNSSPQILNIPTYFSPQPSQQDYKIGEFQRYFVKKTNELIYIEISRDTFDKIINQDPTYLWYYYTPFYITWNISGNKEQVYNINKNIVELIINNLNLYKFNDYLRNDYLKFYK